MIRFFILNKLTWCKKIQEKTHSLLLFFSGLIVFSVFIVMVYWLYEQGGANIYFNRLIVAAEYDQAFCPGPDQSLLKKTFKYAEFYPFDRCASTIEPIYRKQLESSVARGFSAVLLKARAGDARAQYQVYAAYRYGIVADDSDLKARYSWLEKSANQGYLPAQLALSRYLDILYMLSKNNLDDKHKVLKERLNRLVDQLAKSGDAEALLYKANLAYRDHPEKAETILIKLAEQGNAEAYVVLGSLYSHGKLVNIEKSEHYLQKALASNLIGVADRANIYSALLYLAGLQGRSQGQAVADYKKQQTELISLAQGYSLDK